MRGIQPLRIGPPTQPSQLTLGKLSRRGNRLFRRLVQRTLSGQMSPYLSISDRTHGWMFRAQITSFVQAPDLGYEPGVEHCLESPFNVGV
jgi:hypothetical protein